MDEPKKPSRPTSVYSGNPRITVSLPFSRIDVHEPVGAVSDLAAMVSRLAEQVAALAHRATVDGADGADVAGAADALAEEARHLALRLGADVTTAPAP
jgi:hypothetical protein